MLIDIPDEAVAQFKEAQAAIARAYAKFGITSDELEEALEAWDEELQTFVAVFNSSPRPADPVVVAQAVLTIAESYIEHGDGLGTSRSKLEIRADVFEDILAVFKDPFMQASAITAAQTIKEETV